MAGPAAKGFGPDLPAGSRPGGRISERGVDKNIFVVLCLAIGMAIFQIHRMKESARLAFRSAAHTAGLAMIKPKDYEREGEAEGSSAYGVWASLQDKDGALDVGDVLELPDGTLRIYKYVGFEEARWALPEVRSGLEAMPAASGAPPPLEAVAAASTVSA